MRADAATTPKTHLPENNLDCLRVTAVSLVVACHYLKFIWPRSEFLEIFNLLGRVGVIIFFVHTTQVLMSSMERIRSEPILRRYWKSVFYVRRVFRIYPLAGAMTLAFLVMFRLETGGNHIAPRNLIANLLLIQNLLNEQEVFGVFWSLAVEVQMYLVLPLCFWWVQKRGVHGAFEALALGMLAARLTSIMPLRALHLVPANLALVIFAPCFLSGLAAYAVIRQGVPERAKIAGRWWPMLIALLITLSIALYPHLPNSLWLQPWQGWSVCLGFIGLIPFVANMRTSLFTRANGIVAKYSYGIYVLHVPTWDLSFKLLRRFLPPPAQWGLLVVLFVGLPVLAYHCVENPLNVVGKRLTQRLAARLAAQNVLVSAPGQHADVVI